MAVIRLNGKRTVVCGGCGDAPEWTWATHPVCRRCWRWQMAQMRLRQEGGGGQRRRLRAFLLERDGAVCRYCGDTESELTLDHIIAKSRGGLATPWNAVLACEICNQKKQDHLPEHVGMRLLPVEKGQP
jgi:5-methylcytosine-specific restriction endonuclease McrA